MNGQVGRIGGKWIILYQKGSMHLHGHIQKIALFLREKIVRGLMM